MNLIFERKESPDEITIIYKPYPIYAFLALVLVWTGGNIFDQGTLAYMVSKSSIYIALLLMALRLFVTRGVKSEIANAMKIGAVNMSGSAFSASNPVVITIAKRQHAEENA